MTDSLCGEIDVPEAGGWLARLYLGFADRGDKTVLRNRHQEGPLAVQRPLYPEGRTCHTYLLHPPGGVVGGDKLEINAVTEPGAHALVTTPGATKFYRSAGKVATQTQTFTVASGSLLEWLPQENILFPEAKVRFETDIYLAEDARFVGWEMHCFGRPAIGETFPSGLATGLTQVYIGDKLVLAEQLSVRGTRDSQRAASLREFPMTATMMIAGGAGNLLEPVQKWLLQNDVQLNKEGVVAGATLIDGLLVIRALAKGTEPLLAMYTQFWQMARENWFGYAPDEPRIWKT
ncbi:urease accessory protein UreD [Parasalinivibrio latis]|uniref:urease accessory protein UreD n=1 Tax=Parasalinivibrio latis TaxID=2952610 RepID=UPI0030E08D5C